MANSDGGSGCVGARSWLGNHKDRMFKRTVAETIAVALIIYLRGPSG